MKLADRRTVQQDKRANERSEVSDVTIASLTRRLYELEAENANFKKSEKRARKNEFRTTGIFLLVFGFVVAFIAYPSYNYSTISNVLMMVGVGAIFLGAITAFLNAETFISYKVSERLNLSTIVVLDDLLRDLRLKNRAVYIPASKAAAGIKMFVPLKHKYKLPATTQLEGDATFLIGLQDTAQEGVLMQPLGYNLFRYTKEDLKVAWGAGERKSEKQHDEPNPSNQPDSLSEKLKDVLTKGLEIADTVAVSERDGTLQVSMQNTRYFSACYSIMEQAPQVCKQLGCPLCSLVACIYTEHADTEVMIESVERRNRNIDVTCTICKEPA